MLSNSFYAKNFHTICPRILIVENYNSKYMILEIRYQIYIHASLTCTTKPTQSKWGRSREQRSKGNKLIENDDYTFRP